jgi:hypothetical protein
MTESTETRTITVRASDFMMALALLLMRAAEVRGDDGGSATTYDDIRDRLLNAYSDGAADNPEAKP